MKNILRTPNNEYQLKTCKNCGKEKLISEFYNKLANTDGLSDYCKECTEKYIKIIKNKKICHKCGEIKSFSEFYKNIRNKDKLAAYCKECMQKYFKNPKTNKTNIPKNSGNPFKLLKKLR